MDEDYGILEETALEERAGELLAYADEYEEYDYNAEVAFYDELGDDEYTGPTFLEFDYED